MRRVGRLHAITDETLQSASLMASWLGFYEKPEQRLPGRCSIRADGFRNCTTGLSIRACGAPIRGGDPKVHRARVVRRKGVATPPSSAP